MRGTSTTVVAVVGPGAGDVVGALDDAPNVRTSRPEDGDGLERAMAAWAAAEHAHSPWFVHDADPLAGVADAWSARFDGQGTAGDLDVARAALLARWRAGSVELPDYYLVVSPEALPATRRHWYLGVLHAAARARVAPVAVTAGPGADGVLGALAALRALGPGPWWPPLDRLLDRVEDVVPDLAGVTDTAAGVPLA